MNKDFYVKLFPAFRSNLFIVSFAKQSHNEKDFHFNRG